MVMIKNRIEFHINNQEQVLLEAAIPISEVIVLAELQSSLPSASDKPIGRRLPLFANIVNLVARREAFLLLKCFFMSMSFVFPLSVFALPRISS